MTLSVLWVLTKGHRTAAQASPTTPAISKHDGQTELQRETYRSILVNPSSHHYKHAIAAAGDFDQEATAVAAIIVARRGSKKVPKATPPTADAIQVRHHVDVDEA